MDIKVFVGIMTVMYIYLFLIPSVNAFQIGFGIEENQRVSSLLDLSFWGNTYGFYLLLGFALNYFKESIRNILFYIVNKVVLWCLGIFAFVGTVWSQLFLYEKGFAYNIWYDFSYFQCGLFFYL